MKSFQEILPQVETFCLFSSLRVGCLLVAFLCLVFDAFYIYNLLQVRPSLLENGSAAKILGGGAVLILSTVILTISNIILILGTCKGQCGKVKAWLYGIAQNIIIIILVEFIMSPLFFIRNETNYVYPRDVLAQWPLTIGFSVYALIKFYFMIVVNSYYVQCKNE